MALKHKDPFRVALSVRRPQRKKRGPAIFRSTNHDKTGDHTITAERGVINQHNNRHQNSHLAARTQYCDYARTQFREWEPPELPFYDAFINAHKLAVTNTLLCGQQLACNTWRMPGTALGNTNELYTNLLICTVCTHSSSSTTSAS